MILSRRTQLSNCPNFGAQVKTAVDLPARIQDIVAISGIAFRSAPNLPAITLTSQGTGAQSIILYQTHFILDSDRSLHQGMYFPIWLLEEPESFLHADIAFKLAGLLSSSEWLGSVQMLIATHSPIILAAGRQNPDLARWIILDNQEKSKDKNVSAVIPDDILEVGRLMGDSNFSAYFDAANSEDQIIIEDTRPETLAALQHCGIPVTKSVRGSSEIKKYMGVFLASGIPLQSKLTFIVDSDDGLNDLSDFIGPAFLPRARGGFRLYRYPQNKNVRLITLPAGEAVEDLFDDFAQQVETAKNLMFEANGVLKATIPQHLVRAAAQLKGRVMEDDAICVFLRKAQEVKDKFWAGSNFRLVPQKKAALRALLRLTST